ncbi:DinB family protein [Rhodococcus spelaei]|uniref:DinB family protein n=1 Tax=Rhodococcus spelaei TaxID=2546320 RepID=A0A541AZV6_9NOCA|nr:DUF664 domain-containing protein [Rhodococcus spelaei]TQF65601.1 DinB family protein [Rhodococcus spelaei]
MTTTDERDLLLGVLARQRAALRGALSGLTEEQARSVPSASSMSLAALLKHVVRGEEQALALLTGDPGDADPDPVAGWLSGWQVSGDETVATLLARQHAVAERMAAQIRVESDLTRQPVIPAAVAQWFDEGVHDVRWVLLHQIEEQARHAGHADVIRESIDGAQAAQLTGS